MAARTFTSAGVNNLWSNAANWDGGVAVPADGDSVTIPANQTCIYDYDTSGWTTGIAGITITGTLSVSTTTSSYMKMKAATTISGAGTFNVGTSGTPIPFAVKFTLTGGSGWYVQGSGGLTMGVYGAEPQYKYAKLVNAESAGATRLEVDTDLTGDIWAATDSIRINNVAQAQQTELRTIGAITSTYIDITAGLTASKLAGSYIVLVTRNVTITGLGASILQNFAGGKLNIAGGLLTSDIYYGLYNCTGATVSGGAFSGNAYGLYNCTGATVSGGAFSGNGSGLNSCPGATVSGGAFSGNTYGVNSCTGATVSGGAFSGNTYGLYNCTGATVSGGAFSGNGRGLYNCPGATVSGGAFSGNTYGVNSCTGATVSGGAFSGNTYGLYNCSFSITNATFTTNTYDIRESQFTAYNEALTSTVENYLYTNFSRNIYSESIDHNQVAGAFKSWTMGGVTTSVATPVPTGFTRSYQLALENATVEGFFNRRVNVPAGKTITLTLHLRKSTSMTYLPRVWVHKYGTEPFTTPADILHTFTMTNSTNTWESDTYSWTNTADYDVELNCRFVGMNATGYVYGQVADTFAGGGGISKSRIIGGV